MTGYLISMGLACIFWGVVLAVANMNKDNPKCDNCKRFVKDTPVFEMVFLTIFTPILGIVLIILGVWFIVEAIMEAFKE